MPMRASAGPTQASSSSRRGSALPGCPEPPHTGHRRSRPQHASHGAEDRAHVGEHQVGRLEVALETQDLGACEPELARRLVGRPAPLQHRVDERRDERVRGRALGRGVLVGGRAETRGEELGDEILHGICVGRLAPPLEAKTVKPVEGIGGVLGHEVGA